MLYHADLKNIRLMKANEGAIHNDRVPFQKRLYLHNVEGQSGRD